MRRRRFYYRSRLELVCLESRLAPAVATEIVSRVAPSMASEAAGAYEVREQSGVALTYSPRIASSDGRFHVFTSNANNLVPGVTDRNDTSDIFLLDRTIGTITLVSHKSGQTHVAADFLSREPAISADGRFVVYSSWATDVITEVQYESASSVQVYLWDRLTANSSLVSSRIGAPNVASNGQCHSPIISDNGQVIAYQSSATNLVAGYNVDDSGGSKGTMHAYAYNVTTGMTTLIDRVVGSVNTPGNSFAQPIDISSNGDLITIVSGSKTLGLSFPPFTSQRNVYLHQASTGQLTPVSFSATASSKTSNGLSLMPLIDAAGTGVVFHSNATDLGFAGSAGVYNVVRYDIATGTRTLVSHAAGVPGVGGNGSSRLTAISADGRYAVFQSQATDLVAGQVDVNGADADVFVHDSLTNQVTLVSRSSGTSATTGNRGIPANASVAANISDDGSIVTFTSPATDLVAGFVDRNDANVMFDLPYDLFAYHQATGAVQLVSGRLGSTTQGIDRGAHRFDGNGKAGVILWSSLGSDVVNIRDTNVQTDVFLTDLNVGTTTLVSQVNGTPTLAAGTIDGFATGATTTPDGRFIAYVSAAINIIPGQIDKPYTYDVFLLDRSTGQTVLVSHDHANPLASDLNLNATTGSGQPVISDDGRYVVYSSQSNRLVPGFIDGNGTGFGDSEFQDLYQYDRLTGINTLISRRWDNPLAGGNYNTGRITPQSPAVPAVSADGRYVAFQSQAGDLIPGFVEGAPSTVYPTHNLYLWDRVSGDIQLMSGQVGQPATGGTYASGQPSMSADGRFIAYWSGSRNLVAGMTSSAIDVFIYDRVTGQNSLASHVPGSTVVGGNGASEFPQMSRDGSFIVFTSLASNIVAGATDTNNTSDIFLHERATGVITLVSRAHNSANTAASRWSGFREYNNLDLMSDDGRFITYLSGADNLVPGFVDQNGVFPGPLWGDAYLYDRVTNTVPVHGSA